MKRIALKSLWLAKGGAAAAVVLMAGCASTASIQTEMPVDALYKGASLQPDLGSVLLRVADADPRHRATARVARG